MLAADQVLLPSKLPWLPAAVNIRHPLPQWCRQGSFYDTLCFRRDCFVGTRDSTWAYVSQNRRHYTRQEMPLSVVMCTHYPQLYGMNRVAAFMCSADYCFAVILTNETTVSVLWWAICIQFLISLMNFAAFICIISSVSSVTDNMMLFAKLTSTVLRILSALSSAHY